MHIREIKEQRNMAVTGMRAILDKASTENRDLTAEENQKYDAMKGDVLKLDGSIRRQEELDDFERRSAGTPVTGNADAKLDAELRNFSITRAIAGAAGMNVDDGREKEISAELERRSGRKAEGIMVPYQTMERRVLTSALPAGGPGSNVIATDFRGDLFIDRLRAAMVVRRLGARVLTGLVGNVAIPGLKASASAGWVAENTALTASDPTFRQVGLTPKHAGGIVEMSRNMLMQSSPDVETLIRDDLALILAEAVDAVAIQGGGANQPTGILATAGIGDVAMGATGGAPTWAAVLSLIASLENANTEGKAFLTNPSVVIKCRQTLKDAGLPGHLMEAPNDLAGYPLASTTLVPSNLTKSSGTGLSALIFGDFSDLILGFWSELDILVNPFESTAYSKGNVQVRAMMTLDLAVRHPESFAAIKDIATV